MGCFSPRYIPKIDICPKFDLTIRRLRPLDEGDPGGQCSEVVNIVCVQSIGCEFGGNAQPVKLSITCFFDILFTF
jgi:hypothetical protein